MCSIHREVVLYVIFVYLSLFDTLLQMLFISFVLHAAQKKHDLYVCVRECVCVFVRPNDTSQYDSSCFCSGFWLYLQKRKDFFFFFLSFSSRYDVSTTNDICLAVFFKKNSLVLIVDRSSSTMVNKQHNCVENCVLSLRSILKDIPKLSISCQVEHNMYVWIAVIWKTQKRLPMHSTSTCAECLRWIYLL